MIMKTSACLLAVVATVFSFSRLTQAAELATKPALTLAAAKQIAAAAESEAVKNKWNVVIAIVDDGAHLVYMQRLDGAPRGSIDVALAKAKTAVNFQRSTKALEDVVAGGRTVLLAVPGVLPVQGGVPIVHEGAVIGAVGVSGATSQQDEQVATAGINTLSTAPGK
jgi:glc operon protein GlcG